MSDREFGFSRIRSGGFLLTFESTSPEFPELLGQDQPDSHTLYGENWAEDCLNFSPYVRGEIKLFRLILQAKAPKLNTTRKPESVRAFPHFTEAGS